MSDLVITDAQVHIWEADRPSRPWTGVGHTYAHAPEFGADALLAEMDTAGVDRAVLVPPSWEGDRNDVCLAAARAHPERFAVMGRLDLRDAGAPAALRGWLDQPGMLGIRVTFSRGLNTNAADPEIEWFWALVEELGIPVMASVAAYLEEMPGILSRHPGARVIIDHMGIAVGVKDADADAVLDRLLPLARFDNVAVKATALPATVSEPYPFPSLHDRVYRVLDAFGPRRVFWGSDVTRIPCDYRSSVTLFTEELDRLSDEDREWVMGRGLSTWLGWER